MASTQAALVALFLFSGIPLYYTFVRGWRYFPGLGTLSQISIVLISGYWPLKILVGRSVADVTPRQEGHGPRGCEREPLLASDDLESSQPKDLA